MLPYDWAQRLTQKPVENPRQPCHTLDVKIAERFQKLAEGALFLPDAIDDKSPLV